MEADLEADLGQSNERAAAAKVCLKAVKEEFSTIKVELMASRVKYANLRLGRNEMVSRKQRMKVDVNKALKAV